METKKQNVYPNQRLLFISLTSVLIVMVMLLMVTQPVMADTSPTAGDIPLPDSAVPTQTLSLPAAELMSVLPADLINTVPLSLSLSSNALMSVPPSELMSVNPLTMPLFTEVRPIKPIDNVVENMEMVLGDAWEKPTAVSLRGITVAENDHTYLLLMMAFFLLPTGVVLCLRRR